MSASTFSMRGCLPLLFLCTLVSFPGSCETGTFNPWLSPAQVEVEEECDVFTGSIIADEWAGRPIKTKHGVRYRASTRPIRLPATVRLVIVEAWQGGTCPKTPKLQEIPEDGSVNHILPAVTFTANQHGEEGARVLDVQEAKFDLSSLTPEKSFPWPFWPFTRDGRPNMRLYVLEIANARPGPGVLELRPCIAEHCSLMEWPTKGSGSR